MYTREGVSILTISSGECYSAVVETLADFAVRFNPVFQELLSKEIEKITDCSTDENVLYAYRHLVTLASAGGKRIRPYVASLLYRACGNASDEDIMHFLIFLETFHLFALVHDDIMDSADERYGQPTVHAALRTRLAQRGAMGDIRSASIAEAILCGDLLLTLVHQFTLNQQGGIVPRERVDEAHRLLILMSREMVIGQHLDIEFPTRLDVSERDILNRHHLKTSLYTFVRPMHIGAVLGGANAAVRHFCIAFGSALGMGFQLEDDLLDLLSNETAMGKAPGADLTQRQHTLLTAQLRQHGTKEQSAVLESVWGKALSPEQLNTARALFHDSGATDAVRSRAAEAFGEARGLLRGAPLPAEAAQALERLLQFFEHRLP